ncbi:MAG: hypothetical protein ACM3UO_00545 [Bacillota bacterium]
MSKASVIFIICLIVLVGAAGVIAVAFERRRVRANAAPDRIPRRFRLGRRAAERAESARSRHAKGVPGAADPTSDHEEEAAYERTRRLPDGSGGRFEED